ncbi:uncharacterized protein ASPGLDRAFT_268315 [Aspergillus glaucus CBS 516.65]|uniref:Uncharacterized protein n=1 Tax=Aspergillus glaucus CBS 516.65 TaxID=1160497 RepID=A0A1L9W087_ASPGL|nr:hypothetical protein ASPGLDRAFT_268315 [Aspergillus glaucus CBS 516.65]OJJ89593.1 hypothetical protein ASPGLDRAFT_268315 [Aspergillus glaucus CBS 516.65]
MPIGLDVYKKDAAPCRSRGDLLFCISIHQGCITHPLQPNDMHASLRLSTLSAISTASVRLCLHMPNYAIVCYFYKTRNIVADVVNTALPCLISNPYRGRSTILILRDSDPFFTTQISLNELCLLNCAYSPFGHIFWMLKLLPCLMFPFLQLTCAVTVR